jgi:hypothetical protein
MATTSAGLPVNKAGEKIADRRRAERYKLALRASVEGTDGSGALFREESVLVDLSSRGAALPLMIDQPRGARLTVSIKLPFANSTWMQYCATVVRVERRSGINRVGLEFHCPQPRFIKK